MGRGLAVHAELSTPAKPGVEWSATTVDDRRRFQEAMAVRAAAIGRMDRAIGRVLEQVKAMGVWNQTVVLFTSSSGAVVNFETASTAGGGGIADRQPGRPDRIRCEHAFSVLGWDGL